MREAERLAVAIKAAEETFLTFPGTLAASVRKSAEAAVAALDRHDASAGVERPVVVTEEMVRVPIQDLLAEVVNTVSALRLHEVLSRHADRLEVASNTVRAALTAAPPAAAPGPSAEQTVPDLRAKLVEAARTAAQFTPNGWSANAWKALAAWVQGERR